MGALPLQGCGGATPDEDTSELHWEDLGDAFVIHPSDVDPDARLISLHRDRIMITAEYANEGSAASFEIEGTGPCSEPA